MLEVQAFNSGSMILTISSRDKWEEPWPRYEFILIGSESAKKLGDALIRFAKEGVK